MRGPYKALFDKLQESGMYRKDRVFPLNDYKNLILFVRDEPRDVSDPPGRR